MVDLPTAPATDKEREKVQVKEEISEKVPVVRVDEEPRIEEKLAKEGYIEKVEKEVELKKPVTDDKGQILVTAPSAEEPKIVLPITEKTYLNPKNWRQPVTQAIRWLVTWVKRIVKMYPGKTLFQR